MAQSDPIKQRLLYMSFIDKYFLVFNLKCVLSINFAPQS